MTSSSANVRQGLAGQALRHGYLTEHGVIVAGPARPGPLGRRLSTSITVRQSPRVVTVGFVDSVLSVGVPDRSQLDYQWERHLRTSMLIQRAPALAAPLARLHYVSELDGLRQVSPTTMCLSSIRASMGHHAWRSQVNA